MWWETGCFYSLQVFLHNIFIDYKGENRNFLTVEESGTPILTKWWKVTSPVMRHVTSCVPWYHTLRRIHHHFCSILAKDTLFGFIYKERQKNPHQRTFYKTTGQYSSKVSRSWKKNKDWEMIPGWTRPRNHDSWNHCVSLDWIKDQKRAIRGTTDENSINSIDYTFFNVIYLVLIIVLRLCKMLTFGDDGWRVNGILHYFATLLYL